MILVKSDYDTAVRFEKTGCMTKIGNKKHQVLFKLYCDSLSIDSCISLYKRFPNVVVLEYQGEARELSIKDIKGVRIIKTYESGVNITKEEIEDISESLPEGVSAVIKLPEDYSDMRFIYGISQKYANIRFCGGMLFRLEGCNLGCCECDYLTKLGMKYDDSNYIYEGCACAVNAYNIEEVELEEGKPIKLSGHNRGSSGTKKQNKKTIKMQELLSQFGSFEL